MSAPQRPEAEASLRRAAQEAGSRLHQVSREKSSTAHQGEPVGASAAGDTTWRWREGTEPATIDVQGPSGEMTGLQVALLGDHQRDNATVAVAALQLLGERGFRVGEDAIRRGLAEVRWPGRVQLLRKRPAVVVDAAHNADSVEQLMGTIRRHFQYSRLILVFGASGEKDVAGMARILGPASSRVIVTSSGHRRAANLGSLADAFHSYATTEQFSEPEGALAAALSAATPDDLVLVTGSVFLAGRAILLLGEKSGIGSEGPAPRVDG